MANIEVTVPKLKVQRVDYVIDVKGHGKLTISQGSADWKPTRKSVKQYKFTWKQFAAALEATKHVTADKKAVKKAAVKKAAKKVKAPAAP